MELDYHQFILTTGYLLYGAVGGVTVGVAGGVLNKIGEKVYNCLEVKAPQFFSKIINSRKSPKNIDLELYAKEFKGIIDKDKDLKELVINLCQELEKSGARIDNRKIVYGNEANQTYNAENIQIISGGKVTTKIIKNINYLNKKDEGVKKNDF